VLVSLVGAIWFQDFMRETPYRDLLPPNNMIFAHPIAFFSRWWEVYAMHVDYVSAQNAEKRRQNADDVVKRSEYRKAHGIGQEEGVFGGWMAKEEKPGVDSALREGGGVATDASPIALPVVEGKEDMYVDFEGKPQAARKKWLGIW
jgi:hypothetical protein